MVQFLPRPLIALSLCALAVYGLCRQFDPQRCHGRILQQCVRGVIILLCWNIVLPVHLGVNPLSAWLAGWLGLPGLGLLTALKLMA